MLTSFLTTTGLVAIAEIGDKTQLLSLLLAARFRRPLPILAAILVATVANHLLAAALGVWLDDLLGDEVLRWALGASFIAMAVWTLIPDKLDGEAVTFQKWGAFFTTLVAFFIAEIGDKTQLATTALAARYSSVVLITMGSTLGLFLANAPVVFLGDKLVARLPMTLVRRIAAVFFLILGILSFLGW
ncbi:TMEM165/GDT1 family protein [uncultured Ferrovibrio sp.]|mgnify:FL=1|uniref:TMEM165/GDT1 family protein n=1 Tax=uncultured Ferrovibrio sp. TaxID=1576913 RepID=UPI002622E626|nr:TMEM165/GDT1 family protein [uncultured Ferrovibrio sp.]